MGEIYILNIVKQTGADGEGLRNSLYMAGCSHHCSECHNPQSWDIHNGNPVSIDEIIEQLVDEYCNITISGGDPFYQPEGLFQLLKTLKETHPEKNIWVYTGYTYEQLIKNEQFKKSLQYIDVLVDGPYDHTKRNLSRFCGSTNQRILYLKEGIINKIK